MKKALKGLNPDGTPSWVDVPEPTNTQTAHRAPATVSYTEDDRQHLQSLGYHTEPAVLESCSAIPLDIASTPPEAIFGSGSNAKLAQEIRSKYPLLYYTIREKAVYLGLVAPQPNLKLRKQ